MVFPAIMYGCESWTVRLNWTELSTPTQEKEMEKGKMVVWWGLTNNGEEPLSSSLYWSFHICCMVLTIMYALLINIDSVQFSSVQLLSRVWLFATSWTAAHQASLSITNSRSLPKLMSIESVMPSSILILCRPLLLLPPIPPSIRVFSNESTLHMSISPSSEHPGLISFRMDWLDLLAVQGTLKSLLQHHSSKTSILWRSVFFTVQHSHPYWKTHSLD